MPSDGKSSLCLWQGELTTWPPQTILVSDWLISKKSSPLLKER
jgi:hypothetical protein